MAKVEFLEHIRTSSKRRSGHRTFSHSAGINKTLDELLGTNGVYTPPEGRITEEVLAALPIAFSQNVIDGKRVFCRTQYLGEDRHSYPPRTGNYIAHSLVAESNDPISFWQLTEEIEWKTHLTDEEDPSRENDLHKGDKGVIILPNSLKKSLEFNPKTARYLAETKEFLKKEGNAAKMQEIIANTLQGQRMVLVDEPDALLMWAKILSISVPQHLSQTLSLSSYFETKTAGYFAFRGVTPQNWLEEDTLAQRYNTKVVHGNAVNNAYAKEIVDIFLNKDEREYNTFMAKHARAANLQALNAAATTQMVANGAPTTAAPPPPPPPAPKPVSSDLKAAMQRNIFWQNQYMQQVLLDEPISVNVNKKTEKKINVADVPWHKVCYVFKCSYHRPGFDYFNSPRTLNELRVTDTRGIWYFGREGDVNPSKDIALGKQYEKTKEFPAMEMEAAMMLGFPRGFERKFEAMRQNYTQYQWSDRMKPLIDAGLFEQPYSAIKAAVYDLAPQQQMQPWVIEALKNDTAKIYLTPQPPRQSQQQQQQQQQPRLTANTPPPSGTTPSPTTTTQPPPKTSSASTPQPPAEEEKSTDYGTLIKAAGGLALLAGGAYLASQEDTEMNTPTRPSASPSAPRGQNRQAPEKKKMGFASVSMMLVGAVLTGWAALTYYQRKTSA